MADFLVEVADCVSEWVGGRLRVLGDWEAGQAGIGEAVVAYREDKQ